MAKQNKSSEDKLFVNTDKRIHKYFYFSDPVEFMIFLVWSLLVATFLTTMVK